VDEASGDNGDRTKEDQTEKDQAILKPSA